MPQRLQSDNFSSSNFKQELRESPTSSPDAHILRWCKNSQLYKSDICESSTPQGTTVKISDIQQLEAQLSKCSYGRVMQVYKLLCVMIAAVVLELVAFSICVTFCRDSYRILACVLLAVIVVIGICMAVAIFVYVRRSKTFRISETRKVICSAQIDIFHGLGAVGHLHVKLVMLQVCLINVSTRATNEIKSKVDHLTFMTYT